MSSEKRRGRTLDALQAALAAEHAAVYGYGVLGARLPAARRGTARTIWDDHRAARDRLADLVTARRARPVAAEPSYALPVRVTSARTAAALAAVLEDNVMKSYVGLTGAKDPKLRRLAALAMQEAMTRAVTWRTLSGIRPGPAAAFPGLPQAALSPRPGQ